MNYDDLNHDLLSEERTRDLLTQAKAGNRDAAGELIVHNERLIYSIAKRYYATGATGDSHLSDLMQEGRMGLLHAIKKFDLDRNIKFSTYCTFWIKQRIRRFGIHDGMKFSMAYSNAEKRAKAMYCRAQLTETLEREPTSAEICAASGVSGVVARSLDIRVISLDRTETLDGDTYSGSIIDPSAEPELLVEKELDAQDLIRKLFIDFTSRERD
jgi:RNA polymerase primary sigma factor